MKTKSSNLKGKEVTVGKEYLYAIKILTPKKVVILDLISEDYTTRQIAKELGNRPHTIERHREEIRQILDISGYNCLKDWCEENISE